jgi:hypothetical protein
MLGSIENLESPLVGVCSMPGRKLSPDLCALLLAKVNGSLFVEDGIRDTLDGEMSSNSSGGADAFSGGSRGRAPNELRCLFLLGVAMTCTP